MANESGDNTTSTDTEPLRSNVSTGRDNLMEVGPFRVYDVDCPEKWDPLNETLLVRYAIHDPNRRAVSGRILYLVPAGGGAREIVHTQTLTPAQFMQGRHELEAGQQWDGTISEGLTDRIGQKVRIDISPIWARVEIWNHSGSYSGGTGEYLSFDSDTSGIDAVAEARWETHRSIPYEDPDEPDLGWTKMTILVRNVREGTAVRIRVARIADIRLEGLDEIYAETERNAADQPGLEGCIVRGGRVVLADGTEPYVRWNRYSEHWPYENENNFYCFHLAFGEEGVFMVASERDYENHERDCLHMRFTVFIQAPSTDLSYHVDAARSLNRFFRRQTKYFRSYLKIRQFNSLQDWANHVRYRYIVIILGHASCGCEHADHPRKTDGSFKRVFRRRFASDQNICPDDLDETPNYGGCGQKNGVQHYILLGRFPSGASPATHAGKQSWLGNDATWDNNQRAHLSVEDVGGTHVSMTWIPRFLFHTGGCSTMLTTNFGEYFVKAGTKFYSGWIYVGLDFAEYRFSRRLFRRWIKGTSTDRPAAEYLTNRFVQAYASAAAIPSVSRYHPRLIDRSCRPVPPSTLEDILT